MNRSPLFTFIGAFASLAYFAFLGLLVLVAAVAECFEGLGHRCPSETEKTLLLIGIFVGGCAIYGVAAWIIMALFRWRDAD